MTDPREIALRALRAAGHDQAAELVDAIIPAAVQPQPETVSTAVAAPEIPAADLVPAPVAAAVPAGPQPPPGKAPLRTVEEWEALPQAEQIARMDECDALVYGGGS